MAKQNNRISNLGIINMDKKKKIAWEKWYSPFGFLEDEDDVLLDELDELDEFNQMLPKPQKKVPYISTPMGVIPMNEHTNADDIFNFWTIHTNFSITMGIKKLIEDVEGVETLDIWTPYRMRVAIGKLFDEDSVRCSVNKKIVEYIDE